MKAQRLSENLWRFADTCNVYLVRCGDRAVAIDYGSGAWRKQLSSLGIRHLDYVLLTHPHADQCRGLARLKNRPFEVHAAGGSDAFLDPDRLAARGTFDPREHGCPSNYSVLKRGVADVHCDLGGYGELWWCGQRIRQQDTPGHSPAGVSLVIDVDGRQVVFCGDAACAGATLWQPYHLEWDHWTGSGVLAAWQGVERLWGLGVDLLCPSHGPAVPERPRAMLRRLADRLCKLYQLKGNISPGENDCYLPQRFMDCGAREVFPDLFAFGGNGYLLRSQTGEAMIVDPCNGDIPALERLMKELGNIRPTAATVSHYHADHSEAVPYLQKTYDARAVLHPLVAEGLSPRNRLQRPWLPAKVVRADSLWPNRGTWRWNEYSFEVAPWPGQTWWHCAFMTVVNGHKVLFAGDSFQPGTRWNGTGGFCAFNGSRFLDGYVPSAELALKWNPDILACGHGTFYHYRASKFRKIIAWARKTDKILRALCPGGDLESHYYAAQNPPASNDEGCFWLT